jgi:hypothetical protein
MTGFESIVEEAAIAWLEELGWRHVPSLLLAPDVEASEAGDVREGGAGGAVAERAGCPRPQSIALGVNLIVVNT